MRAWRLPRPVFVLVVVPSWLLFAACSPNRESTALSSATSVSEARSDTDLEHAHEESTGRPRAPVTAALSPSDRDELTTLRVSAHVGSVIIRKRDDAWVVAGRRCTVPGSRIQAALADLVGLESTPSNEPIPVGSEFELQVDALVGERQALHLELARRDADGDLVRLLDDSTVRLRGLDRALWSPEPEAWCRN
jgi:hypothetical protein